eukprot:1402286-Prymnesium_polylepis.1
MEGSRSDMTTRRASWRATSPQKPLPLPRSSTWVKRSSCRQRSSRLTMRVDEGHSIRPVSSGSPSSPTPHSTSICLPWSNATSGTMRSPTRYSRSVFPQPSSTSGVLAGKKLPAPCSMVSAVTGAV